MPPWTEPPRLRRAQHSHRRATWTELFFDLIFVAAIAQAGEPLTHHYSPDGLLRFGFLFVLIWWSWSGHTLYVSRFDVDDAPQRLLTVVQCFVAAVMAANATDALDSRSSAGFAAAYAVMRLILVAQYLRARRIPETRRLTTRYSAGIGAAAALWMASAFTEPPLRYAIWGAALLVDFATPWLAVRHTVELPPDPVHFPERFGLFTIILFGEFVASVMHGIASQEYWSPGAASAAFSSIAFAFVLRTWYFEGARSAAERHIRSRRQAILFQFWDYAHLPLFVAIAVAGAGFRRIISLQPGERLATAEGWILCGAVSLLMFSLVMIGTTSEGAGRDRAALGRRLAPQVALAATALGLGALAARMHPVAVVLVLLAACMAQSRMAAQFVQSVPAAAAAGR